MSREHRSTGATATGDGFGELRSRAESASERYQRLKASTDEVQTRLRRAHDARRELRTAAELLTTWMNDAKLDDSSLSALDVTALQHALSQTRVITAESSMQRKMMDKLLAAAETLRSVGADDDSVMVESVSARFAHVSESAAERCTELQVAIVRSQGVHEGVDGLLGWIRDAESSLASLVRPAHPDADTIADKLNEAASLRADIEGRASIIDEVNSNATSPGVDAKLTDLNARYERLGAGCQQQQNQLETLSEQLTQFHDAVKLFDAWLLPVSFRISSL